jgi:hypothetical protein
MQVAGPQGLTRVQQQAGHARKDFSCKEKDFSEKSGEARKVHREIPSELLTDLVNAWSLD